MRNQLPARTPWADIVGYSRAVRVGNTIAVSGTIASDEQGKIIGKGDIFAQTVFVIRKIEAALEELRCSLSDVVRTRIYTTDISKWEDVARAHREFFARIRPTNTMVQVAKLIDPEALVEIEAEAIADR